MAINIELNDIFKLIGSAIFNVVLPVFKIMTYFMGFVLIMTFVGNIAGILGFFIFMTMFYYYVKGIIFIEPP